MDGDGKEINGHDSGTDLLEVPTIYIYISYISIYKAYIFKVEFISIQ